MKKFMIAVLLMLASTGLYAGDVDNFVELGADVTTYSDFGDISDLDTSIALNARWGTLMNTGLYAWGSYEQPSVRVLSQNQGDLRMFGVGGGWRVGFAENWYALVEGGYYMPSASSALEPLRYEDDWGGSVGVGYDINEHFTLNGKYRYLKVDQRSGVLDLAANRVDMSTYSVGLSYRF